jgi:hypothetical protein
MEKLPITASETEAEPEAEPEADVEIANAGVHAKTLVLVVVFILQIWSPHPC